MLGKPRVLSIFPNSMNTILYLKIFSRDLCPTLVATVMLRILPISQQPSLA